MSRWALNEAEAMGVPTILGGVVRQILAVTSAKFDLDSDCTSLAKAVEEWAGVPGSRAGRPPRRPASRRS